MSKRNSDHLFLLIKSMSKAEKRYFKLFVSRVKSTENAKFLKLFDLIDKQKDFDEDKILSKESSLKPSQLSNLKAHLYKQILQSLRNYNSANDTDVRIREILDQCTILYNRCLYDQSMKLLERAKYLAETYDRNLLMIEILEFEKKLVIKFIKANIEEKVALITKEQENKVKHFANLTIFSNLTIKLYSYYIKLGFIRNPKDFETVNTFLHSSLPAFREEKLSFDEKMYLYNSFVGYYSFIQDFNRAYEYAIKWVGLFEQDPAMKVPKIEMYIKGIHNLLIAQSKLSKYDEFVETTQTFDTIPDLPDLSLTQNIKLLLFKYSSTHQINKYFMLGEFDKGVKIIPGIAEGLEKFEDLLDVHYTLIFYYKFACMYFGDADYNKTVFWLNKIINSKDMEVRPDIHNFARILNLISHYELENTDLVDYYIRSTYRFLHKKDDMHLYQSYIMEFLKKLNSITSSQLTEGFKELREKLLPLANNPYEKRAFIYFDIISWLESKIYNRTVAEIIREKALKKINSEV